MGLDFAKQSTSHRTHVAIIMDGNGRWAATRGWPRSAGHRAGARTVRTVVEAAPGCGVGTLTLFAFSSDNWQRPPAELGALMQLLAAHLRSETAELRANGMQLSVIGGRERLSPALLEAICHAEQQTRGGTRLHLRIAVDYSARDQLLRAVRHLHSPEAL